MLVEFSIFWTVVLNITAWLVIQLGIAWIFFQMPASWFESSKHQNHRPANFFYDRFLRIKTWKDQLPDATRWFKGGFSKATFTGKSLEYLQRFIAETRRSEICHWMAVLGVVFFPVWNPWWGVLINLGYALLANLPCIWAQRYNRARMMDLLARRISRPNARR